MAHQCHHVGGNDGSLFSMGCYQRAATSHRIDRFRYIFKQNTKTVCSGKFSSGQPNCFFWITLVAVIYDHRSNF